MSVEKRCPFTFPFHNAFNFSLPVNSLLCLFKWMVFRGDTGLHPENDCWHFTDIHKTRCWEWKWGKKRLIMNKFSLLHVAKIFYLLHISLGLYTQLMRFQINVKWTAFKLLFSLEAWHWKREGFHQMTEELLPDPLRSVNRAVLGNAISGMRWWWLFEGLRLLIWWRCGVERKEERCERMPILNEMKSCVQEWVS